jgi:hypothetical protein
MQAIITAPRGRKTATAAALRELGFTPTHRDTQVLIDRRTTSREARLAVAALVRQGTLTVAYSFHPQPLRPGRLLPFVLRAAQRAPESVLRRIAAVRSVDSRRQWEWGPYLIPCDEARDELARRGLLPEGVTLPGTRLPQVLAGIGPAGEQAQADESRYFETWNDRPSNARVNCAEIDSIDVAGDGTAALVTRHVYTLYPRQLRSSEVECYLVVRDATSGERHVLRVPPKFGKRTSKTRQTLLEQGGATALVAGALAWTFGRKAGDYRPARES